MRTTDDVLFAMLEDRVRRLVEARDGSGTAPSSLRVALCSAVAALQPEEDA